MNGAQDESQIGVVGAGLIGMSWAGLFSAFGYETTVYDPNMKDRDCLLYTSPSPRDKRLSRMPSSA